MTALNVPVLLMSRAALGVVVPIPTLPLPKIVIFSVGALSAVPLPPAAAV
jgi:hypothetical protein